MGVRDVLLRLARSAGAGAVSTIVDLSSITILVEVFHVSTRAANVPALTLGAITMFVGQKYFAFRAGGDVRREIVLFASVQAVGFLLNAYLFDLAMRSSVLLAKYYLVTRMGVGNVVWLGYSFPMWHLVFKPRDVLPPPPSST